MVGIYFSGTGNTRYCVEKFLKELDNDCDMYSIEDKQAISAIEENKDILFAYPIQYSNLAKFVRDFINKNSHLWQDKNIFIIATMGLFSGDGAGLSARLFKKYGANIIGGLHLKMPDCIGDVKALKKTLEANKLVVQQAEAQIKDSVLKLKDGKPTKEGLNIWYHIAGLFGQRLYFYNKTKEYTNKLKIDKDKCVGCGKCVTLCPMKNLKIENKKAVNGKRCTMCYRCISNCPKQSITLIGKEVFEQCSIEKYI
ncbi:4Fe-4S dicluster domain-containing protein [Clostridium botulinum]|uniref:EFR1 family ferrodoxin n=1 Tax=Clostridium sp. ZBS18 TaxID=2949967 RepID=UPI001D50DDB6|nr:4Fe-4S dicluster domain-containing protein [Clostridium botulinum]